MTHMCLTLFYVPCCAARSEMAEVFIDLDYFCQVCPFLIGAGSPVLPLLSLPVLTR
jgi:hypothetical protein